MSKRLLIVIMLMTAMTAFAAQWLAYVDNAGFERGELAWDTWGDGDIRSEYFGVTPEDGDNFLRLWKRSGWYQDFPIQAGSTYQLSSYVACAKDDALWGDAFGEVKIEWRNKSDEDSEVGNALSVKFDIDGNQDKKISVDEWTKIKLPVALAPPTATHCRVLLTIWTEGEDAGGGCALFDEVKIVKL